MLYSSLPPRGCRLSLRAPPLSPSQISPLLTNCRLINLSFIFVMGIADGPCSGYVRDKSGESHYRRVLVSLLSTHFPGQKNAAAKQADAAQGSNGNAPSSGSTSAIQPSTKNPSGQSRPTATTSTVSRPRSGWCGFSEGGGLPGPLGRILGG